MLIKKQKYTVDIVDVEPVAGKGVAKLDNFVIFIPFCITGEKVEIQITAVKKSHATGKLLNVITSSPHRIKPLCKFYYSCGGCNLQHISYEEQLRIKSLSAAKNISKISGLEIDTINIIPSPKPFHYRNRIKYTIKNGKKGFINSNYSFMEIKKCEIADKKINELANSVKKHELKNYQNIHLRVDSNKNSVIFLQKNRKTKILSENNILEFSLCNRTFKIKPESFFQVNTSILPQFKDAIESQLNPKPNEVLIDLFCGAGFFSLLFADSYKEVYGLEIDAEAVEKAKQNSLNNKITNAHFYSGSVEKNIGNLLKNNQKENVSAIIDPPRAGMDKNTITCINASKIEKIIYISCYPPTLARDLKLLTEAYNLVSVQAADMFPQTAHTEIICLLERKPSA